MKGNAIELVENGSTRTVQDGDRRMTFVPFTIKKRGARKLLVPPEVPEVVVKTRGKANLDLPMVKALGRGFYWRSQLDGGVRKNAAEIALAEKLDRTWVNETLRLTLLAPDIVTVILEGRQPGDLSLQTLRRGVPLSWETQRILYGFKADEPGENGV